MRPRGSLTLKIELVELCCRKCREGTERNGVTEGEEKAEGTRSASVVVIRLGMTGYAKLILS